MADTSERLVHYTVGEEIAHAVTHGIGVLLSIAGLAVLVAFASLKGGPWHVVSCAIFGATLVLTYTASTVYHAVPATHERTKRILRILDHSAIYLLIAGTYTPFTLVSLRGAWGWSLFGVVWGLAVLGIVLKATLMGRLRVLSVVFYVAMGWIVVIAARPLLTSLEPGGVALLALGGLTYTVGVAFYAWRRLPYGHAVWHGFVLGGSTLHFFAVLFYVVPLKTL